MENFVDFFLSYALFSLIWSFVWRLPGGIFTVIAVVLLVYFWRRGRLPRIFGNRGRRAYDPSRDRGLPPTIAGLSVAYGEGSYEQDGKSFQGRILLTKDKLCLTDKGEEIGPTFVPVGKIVSLEQSGSALTLDVYLSQTEAYRAVVHGNASKLSELARELAGRRGLKKRMMGGWYDPEYH